MSFLHLLRHGHKRPFHSGLRKQAITMATVSSSPAPVAPSQHPPVLIPALQFGAFTGLAGALAGGTAGIIRYSPAGLFAAVSGIQCFALGSAYWAARGAALSTRIPDTITAQHRVYASAFGGAFAGGSVAALFRGRANVVPGVIVFSIIGAVGQSIYNRLDDQHTATLGRETPEPLLTRMAKSRWSPMKVLSDAEYEGMLQERLLRIEAEIAVIDENIKLLKQEAARRESEGRP